MKETTRRVFNKKILTGLGGMTILGNLPKKCAAQSLPKEKLGIALVGLGSYSRGQLAPALVDTKHCYLAGIVTGSPEKEKTWAEKYNIPKKNIYNYENYDTIIDNEDIDIIYVVLPNSMHADFCIRAAKAGKHVICEKPMAVSVKECDDIIDACKAANVKLSVGYRLHSEPYTQEVMRMVKEKTYGEVLYVTAEAGYYSGSNPEQWRLNHALAGGGALLNMGVYSIQAAIYGTGLNPISVAAQEFSTRPEYFKDTDETITAQFEFPNGIVGNISTSHNFSVNRLRVTCRKGWIDIDPATGYGPLSGRTSDGKTIEFPHQSQQGLQMDDFAKHILMGETNKVPGEMGKRDMIICEAIYRSIREGGKKIPLDLGTMGIV